MKLSCPNCSSTLVITVTAKDQPPRPARNTATDVSPLTNPALQDVWTFMSTREGRYKAADLYNTYLRWTQMRRPLTQNAFGRALKANGATPWRDSDSRGYEIPPMEQTEPAKMTEKAQERFEAAHQRQAVKEHTGRDTADLPLEVDGL